MNKCLLEDCGNPARQKFCCTNHRHTYYRRLKGIPDKKAKIREVQRMVDVVLQAHKDGEWSQFDNGQKETMEQLDVSMFAVQKARFILGLRKSSPSGKNTRHKEQEKRRIRGIIYTWKVIPEFVGKTRNEIRRSVAC